VLKVVLFFEFQDKMFDSLLYGLMGHYHGRYIPRQSSRFRQSLYLPNNQDAQRPSSISVKIFGEESLHDDYEISL
jgi:hypothetical protein